jgi:hypothetical protein
MGNRRWFAASEKEEALQQAKKKKLFAWSYARRNEIRNVTKITEGFYVGWHTPIEFLTRLVTSKLIYDPMNKNNRCSFIAGKDRRMSRT